MLYDQYTRGVNIVAKFEKLESHFKLATGLTLPHENESDSRFDIDYETFDMIQKKEASTYERWFS